MSEQEKKSSRSHFKATYPFSFFLGFGFHPGPLQLRLCQVHLRRGDGTGHHEAGQGKAGPDQPRARRLVIQSLISIDLLVL